MRRKDREVTDIQAINDILQKCKTCHLAMVDNEQPYLVPLNYAYTLNENVLTLYFHSAKEGRKIDILKNNNAVCFEICIEGMPIFATRTPCNSGYYFSSLLGFGNVQFVDDETEKCNILSLFMKHQADITVNFSPAQAKTVCIFKVITSEFTLKQKVRPVE